jgi:hypothetical protein
LHEPTRNTLTTQPPFSNVLNGECRSPTPARMDDSNGSSSSSESEHDFGAQPRTRAPKFNPGPAESNAIYFQICSDIPYTHSRTGQKPSWVRHLLSLKRQGKC